MWDQQIIQQTLHLGDWIQLKKQKPNSGLKFLLFWSHQKIHGITNKRLAYYLQISDSQVKCNVNLVEIKENIFTRFERISNWDTMKRIMALVLKFKMKLKQKLNGSSNAETEPRVVTDNVLNINELDLGQRHLLKSGQNQAFCKDIEMLKKKGNITRTSRIYGLDPYVDSDGLLRVGGRFWKGELDANIAYPVLLPKNSCTSVAIISWCHKNAAHGGRGLTLNELRQCGLWIVSTSSAIRSLIHRCVVCRKLRGKLGEQKMSDIPKEEFPIIPHLPIVGWICLDQLQ